MRHLKMVAYLLAVGATCGAVAPQLHAQVAAAPQAPAQQNATASGPNATTSTSPSAPADDPAVADLKAFLRSYAEAFNAQNNAALTPMWAEQATYTDRGTGERTVGREAIMADIQQAFEDYPEMRFFASVEQVKFLAPTIAHVEGSATTQIKDGKTDYTFTAIATKSGERWELTAVDEFPIPVPSSSREALMQLDWLVGTWIDEPTEAGSQVTTTVRWSPNESFLIRSFVMQQEGSESPDQGTQVIGWDPRQQQIRSWTFHSDGAFGEGVWSQNGAEWLIRSTQTLADGSAASGTYVVTRDSDNEMSVQLVGHEVDGQPLPTAAAVRVQRVAETESAPTEGEAAQ